MIYEKPKDLKYVDLAIWVDKNMYSENPDYNTIYAYTSILVEMLAKKQKFFNNQQQYEDFSLYTANFVLLRIVNKKQYQQDENGEYKLPKLKSVLNYIKAILYPSKASFVQEAFAQLHPGPELEGEVIPFEGSPIDLPRSTNPLLTVDMTMYLKQIGSVVKKILKDSPYVSNKVVWRNIYVSCMLTFINSITLSNSNKSNLNTKIRKGIVTDGYINQLYQKENSDPVILYHVDSSLHNYIATVTARIKHIISRDIAEMIQYWQPSEDIMKDLLYECHTSEGGFDENDG